MCIAHSRFSSVLRYRRLVHTAKDERPPRPVSKNWDQAICPALPFGTFDTLGTSYHPIGPFVV